MKKTTLLIVASTAVLLVLLLIIFIRTRPTPTSQNTTPSPTPSPFILLTPTPIVVDTFDSGLFEKQAEVERTYRPDLTVANASPYEDEYFGVKTEFIPGTPYGRVVIIVTDKKKDTPQVMRQKVKEWFVSLGLTEAAINALDISYQ